LRVRRLVRWRGRSGADARHRPHHARWANARLDAGLWFGALRAEIHTGQRYVLGAQGGVDAGVIQATGTGAWVPASTEAFWIAIAAGPVARLAVGDRLAIGGTIEALVPPVRPTFAIDTEVMHRPASMSARAIATAELRF